MELSQRLDFLVIGAQKAGTTSLFKYLEQHPGLYMPKEKEAPFFSHDERYQKGWEWFAREFLSNPPSNVLIGKVTPQYMADPRAAERIAQLFPGIRLIALLRNPIERAYSHHKMQARRGAERRSFEDAVAQLMDPQQAALARKLPANDEAENHCYLAWGEYGRILAGYLRYFSRDQILVVFTDELEQRPQHVIDLVTSFLGLDGHYTPANLTTRYHQGGSQQRWPWAPKLMHWGPVWRLWRTIPERVRRAPAYWFHQFNVIPDRRDNPDESFSAFTRLALVNFFKEDLNKLERDLGCNTPWAEFRAQEV